MSLLAVLAVLQLGASPSALAGSRDGEADRAGYGPSYWGPLPAPSDSSRARIDPRPTPAWEWPGRVVYTGVGYPLHLLKLGFREVVRTAGRLSFLPHLLGPWGPYRLGLTASTDGSDGYAFGASAMVAPPGPDRGLLRLNADWSTEHSARGGLGWIAPGGRLSGGARYSIRSENRFYGLGPGAKEDGKSYYTQELAWGGLAYAQPFASRASVQLTALYSEVSARGPVEADYTRIPDLHPVPAGYHERSRGVTVRVGLRHDTTRERARPERGGIELARASRFVETGDQGVDFWSFRAEAQRFVPLIRSKQVLGFRAYVAWLVADDLAAVPFQRLLTNDEPDQFRGYHDYRWRDRGITGATVEYRWPFWAYSRVDDFGADVVLFTDLGQVFGAFDEIRSENVTESYGLGLRFVGPGGYAGRLEAARSEEGWSFRLKGDQLLQFARDGLERGRDLVALR